MYLKSILSSIVTLSPCHLVRSIGIDHWLLQQREVHTMTAFDYARPASLDEAIDLLAANAGARALAGGHSLLLEPNRSRLPAALLVDLRKLPGLSGIQAGEQDGSVAIGAMTPLEQI